MSAGVERDHLAVDIDDRRARRAPGGPGAGLHVEGVEVVVGVPAIDGRPAVDPRDGPVEDDDLLAGVVADDPDLHADLGALRRQLQLCELHVAKVVRIEAIHTEVVDRVPVDGLEIDLLVVDEDRLSADGACVDHVPVGEDQALLGVDDEARAHGARVALRVEAAGPRDLQRHDPRHHGLERLPPRGLLYVLGQRGADEQEHGGR